MYPFNMPAHYPPAFVTAAPKGHNDLQTIEDSFPDPDDLDVTRANIRYWTKWGLYHGMDEGEAQNIGIDHRHVLPPDQQ